ncbi:MULTISPECIES: ABC transporter permease [unclassified Peribacillus]|nr:MULTISPECIES: ABC transporter permease subunit [unclassified Peribacillus]MBK5443483.1 ABC transporter permease subunit [Peribacillus sp. TH24]MBK5461786.1 ABC transporter permease subunit [Peribacillus sp. TH27]MBK5499936.1 ABC transporter permease subunit [Peribacillus sp. TH14]
MSLIRNEWMKIFSKGSTYLFIVFLLLAAVGTALIDYKLNPVESSKDWKQELQAEIQEQQNDLKTSKISEDEKSAIMEEIDLNKQLLDANINPDLRTNWTYMANWTTSLTSFVTLFVVIVCSSLVSSEFSDGTIKQLLIRPYKRWKILLSKYITSLLFAALLLVSLFIFSYIVGILFFGNGSYSDKILDPASFGFSPVIVGDYFVDMMVYWIPGFLVITTIAFMLSTLFKSQALAVGVSISILFASTPLNLVIQSLIEKNEWLKFVLFPHLNLRGYISESFSMFEGATLGFSISVLAIYYLIFLALTFFFFQKKDISN